MTRRLTAADLGLEDEAVEYLAGSVSTADTQMIVRVENIQIFKGIRGQRSFGGMLDHLRAFARRSGMDRLVIEGLSIGNPQLAGILVRRYGGAYTPQRTIVVYLSLE